MAWWGKLIGGTVGFMLGGPLGALLGSSVGHQFDARRKRQGSTGFLPGNQERTQAAFFTATFSVMGHLAKSDGHVSAKEIQPALQRAREAVKSGIPAIVNIWVDKEEFAPGTKNQTMYK